MLHRMALARTDVSEELNTSFISLEEYHLLECDAIREQNQILQSRCHNISAQINCSTRETACVICRQV
jgi:hypothetical protein